MGAKRSAKNTVSKPTRWGWAVIALGLLVIAIPIIIGAHSYWVGFAMKGGFILIIIGLVLSSKGVPDGPPIRRTG